MTEVDVIVVGMGMAALSAAITAHDAGATVLILEKAPEEHAGGNARVSGQAWFSPYDVEAAKRHLRAMSGDYGMPEDVVVTFAEEAAKNNEWVSARLDEVRGRMPRHPLDPLDQSEFQVTRIAYREAAGYAGQDLPEHEFWDVEGNECGTERNMISRQMGFMRLWYTLRQCVIERGIEVRYSTPARALVCDESGAVSGVEATAPDGTPVLIQSNRGVVIATGGFAANPELTRNYLRLPNAVPWGSPYNTGDGLLMGQRAGAAVVHPYNYMSITGIRFGEEFAGDAGDVLDNRYIHVGKDGKRFIDESLGSWHGKARVRGTFDFYPGVPMWTVFDEEGRLAGPIVVPRENFAVGWAKLINNSQWSVDNSAEVEKGWIVKADTIRQLAEKLGIDPDGLEAEVARYNDAISKGIDDPRFDRPLKTMTPIAKAPFYGYAWGQLLITTLGGLHKDGQARVIDLDGAPIPRLYTAGEVASSFTWLLAGGLSLADCFSFGRVAGRNAAAESPRSVSGAGTKIATNA